MTNIPAEYKEMIHTALRNEKRTKIQNNDSERPLKRRKRKVDNVNDSSIDNDKTNVSKRVLLTPVQRIRELKKNPQVRISDEQERYIVHIDDDDDDGDNDSFGKSGKKIINSADKVIIASEPITISDEYKEEDIEESDEDIDSDEFEDVDLDGNSFLDDGDDDDQDLNITIKQHRNAKKAKKSHTVNREERKFRRSLHLMYLFTMVGHGVSRNVWLTDPKFLIKVQKQIPFDLKNELNKYLKHRSLNATVQSKTRKLLDLLRHLMEYWLKIWTIDSKAPVIYKKTWSELKYRNTMIKSKHQFMNKRKFMDSILTHVGSRDIAAQGFVALLRSINLPARLVFSIQPPDFTNMKKCDDSTTQNNNDIQETKKSGKSTVQSTNLLSMLRSKKSYTNKITKTQAQKDDEFSENFGAWPVFWVEVWDKDSKKHITIDPIVKKTIELVNWKSKLEPPMNCIRNNSWYIVGYDRVGGIRDITRRYAKEYNAKVRKKRITRESKWEKWWEDLLHGGCSSRRLKNNKVDKFEQIEFDELSLKEGMPSSVNDFKNHPIYVLENDLKFNEILMPKISCGRLAVKGKSKNSNEGFLPVYKRTNVHIVRSPRGWFMRGRVLKIGERPLKIREKSKKKSSRKKRGTEDEFELSDHEDEDNDGDDENDGRLYAEFQTEKYKPPPVIDGIIPKNAFNNIDIYEPWMIPDGCVHIQDKLSEKAAKVMNIEYAPAVVGFDFKGPRRDVSVKIQGIVTLNEFKDAVELCCIGLKEMDENDEKMRNDLINLRSWRILLTKLKIRKRLDYEHGEIDNDEDDEENEAIESDDSNSEPDSNDFEAGGFMFDTNLQTASSRTRSHFNNNESEKDPKLYVEDVPDLSASDFESDIEPHDGGGGGFSIKQIDDYRKGMDKKKKGFSLSKKSENVKSMFDASNDVFDNNGKSVYNPDGDRRYDDNESDNSSDGGDNDERFAQLDKEFTEFENEIDLNQQAKREDNRNDRNDVDNDYGDDDDYEFEYSDS